MNRPYELGFIIPNTVTEHETSGVIDTVKGWISDLGGEVVKVDYWGRRRLAYLINDMREGYYVFVTMAIEPSKIAELERILRLSNQVNRHLVVRLDEEEAVQAAESSESQAAVETAAETAGDDIPEATPEEPAE